jgi:hypothetical protein
MLQYWFGVKPLKNKKSNQENNLLRFYSAAAKTLQLAALNFNQQFNRAWFHAIMKVFFRIPH